MTKENKDVEKLKKVLIYLVAHLKYKYKYKQELIKLCFIVDYKYCKTFGSKDNATSIEYVKNNYGPYSESFIEAFEQLKDDGILIEVGLPFGAGFILEKDAYFDGLDDNIKKLIDEVIKEYGQKTLREIKAFIYDLEEFKKTEFGNTIEVEK